MPCDLQTNVWKRTISFCLPAYGAFFTASGPGSCRTLDWDGLLEVNMKSAITLTLNEAGYLVDQSRATINRAIDQGVIKARLFRDDLAAGRERAARTPSGRQRSRSGRVCDRVGQLTADQRHEKLRGAGWLRRTDPDPASRLLARHRCA